MSQEPTQDPKTTPDSEKTTISIDPRTLTALDPQTIERLRNEFGATLEVRASMAGMAALLDRLGAQAMTGGAAVAADFDRVFDRTNPGYDRMFDRDHPA